MSAPQAAPRYLTHGRPAILSFIHAIAHAPTREATVSTNPMSYGQAMTFRRDIYTWRRSLLNELRHPQRAEMAAKYVEDTFGLRVTYQWLDLLLLRVADSDAPEAKVVVATIRRPEYGPDIRFADLNQSALGEAMAILQAASLRQAPTAPQPQSQPPITTPPTEDELVAIAMDLRCDPLAMQQRALVLAGEGLPRATILDIIRGEFA